jgi:hypothetical protein
MNAIEKQAEKECLHSFQVYAQSTAFSMSMSKSAIELLDKISRYQRSNYAMRYCDAILDPAWKQLKRRGLVYHLPNGDGDNEDVLLSKVGWLVLDLLIACKLA